MAHIVSIFICFFMSNVYLRYANITNFEKTDYHYDQSKEFPEGWAEMEVYLDDATHRRYLSSFGLYERDKNKKGFN